MASPISTQQRSAEESHEQFDRRMRNKVSQVRAADTYSFYKRVSKSMATKVVQGPYAYALEFPIKFLDQHSKKLGIDVTFVMKGSKRTWPIELTVRSYPGSNTQLNSRVFAYGAGGWKSFLQENRIKVGDFLFFTLISFSEFQVVIERAPVEIHSDEDTEVHQDDDGDDNGNNNEGEVDMDIEDEDEDENKDADKSSAKWFRNPWPWWNADQAPPPCRSCKEAPPCPRFLVAIRPSSHPRLLNLAVPGHFWDLHGNRLNCNDLQLRGPNKAIFTVKAKRTYDLDETKLSVRLESGWEAFLVANKLRVGDILEFFLVGNSCFTVDLLERMEEH